ncbi:MAG: YkgJ family cysteine cluster protein [Acidobacteriota bacterium]
MSQDSEKTNSPYGDNFQQLAQCENQEEFVAAAHFAVSRILAQLHVEEERADEILAEVEKDSFYQDFKNSWEDLTPEERANKWPQLLDRIIKTVYACRPYCMRCGECCNRVSPSLHHEDLYLFDEGILRFSDVYTIRKGEPVLDNVKGKLDTLSQELIKIKEPLETRQCFYYDEPSKSCRIYEKRPLQCRTQECWSPDALEKLWSRDKLTRKDFFNNDEELMGLIEIHNQRCSPEELDDAIKNYWESCKMSDLDPVVEMLSQDVIIRNFFVEKLGRDLEELDLILGRRLASVVEAYNLRVEQDESGTYHLIQMG